MSKVNWREQTMYLVSVVYGPRIIEEEICRGCLRCHILTMDDGTRTRCPYCESETEQAHRESMEDSLFDPP